MTFTELLKRIDETLLLLINHDSSSRFLDPVMVTIRNPLTWMPLYIFIAAFIFIKVKKKSWLFAALSLATLIITDSCSDIIKNMVERLRPCYDAGMSDVVRHLVDCGGAYSFPSNHAANHFGLATFWFWSMLQITGSRWKWLWVWAALICYAQVYVGKHFPSDVLAGAFIGVCTGTITAKIFESLLHSKASVKQLLLSKP